MEVVWPHKTTIKRRKNQPTLNLAHGFAPRRFGWPLFPFRET